MRKKNKQVGSRFGLALLDVGDIVSTAGGMDYNVETYERHPHNALGNILHTPCSLAVRYF